MNKKNRLVFIVLIILLIYIGFIKFKSRDSNSVYNYSSIGNNDIIHSIGFVSEGSIPKHTFIIVNDENRTIEINARSSCGCMKATISNTSIPPGKTATITAWLNTKSTIGHVEQYIDVSTNDPQNNFFRITLCVDVIREVLITPDRIWLGEIPRDISISREIVFSWRNDEKLEIKNIVAPKGIDIVLGDTVFKDEITEVPILFKINTGDTLGYFQRSVFVETSHSIIKEHEIEISGQVLQDLKVIPPLIGIRDVALGAEITKEIRLIPIKETISSISAHSTNGLVAIERSRKEDGQFILSISVKAPDHQTSLQDTIKVYYDGNEETDILIPVQVNTVETVSQNSL